MNDCSNAEMRDLLPDLLHDRMPAPVRAEVMAHVDACADCREELELLRGMRSALVTFTPRVNVAYVVNALPKPATTVRPAPRRTWADWRIAATIVVLAAGGTSFALISRGDGRIGSGAPVALVPVRSAPLNETGTLGDSETIRVASETGLGMAGHLADLDESQLQSLIDEIEQMKAEPITEPEPVSIKVDPKGSLIPEGE